MKSVNCASKVIVGMSGGVDSSVAALLLLEQGYRVEGLFMKNWEEDDGTEYCTAKEDFADAQAVADKLGITLHGANFAAADAYRGLYVQRHILAEYKAGRTPNPDILCNREIKFKAFLGVRDSSWKRTISRPGTTLAVVQSKTGKVHLLKGLDRQQGPELFPALRWDIR